MEKEIKLKFFSYLDFTNNDFNEIFTLLYKNYLFHNQKKDKFYV